jgi:hypothetical protein
MLAVMAVIASAREDIIVYETPEYNSFASLLYSPERTIRRMLRYVPIVNLAVRPYFGPSNFVTGPPGYVFKDTPKRLEKKKELLSYFTSQNPELLIRLFGHQTLYRPLLVTAGWSEPREPFSIPLLGAFCDPTVVALAIAMLAVTFLTACEIATALSTALSLPTFTFPALGGLLGIVYLVRKIRRDASLESAAFFWAVALGLIVAAFH